ALLFGLLGMVIGMAVSRPQGWMLLFVAVLFLYPISTFTAGWVLTNFFLPSFAVIYLFMKDVDGSSTSSGPNWHAMPEFFGLGVPPVLYTFAVQAIVGIFLWRITVRKSANPFQAPLRRRETVALFGVLLFLQHGLIWNAWRDALRSGQYHYSSVT